MKEILEQWLDKQSFKPSAKVMLKKTAEAFGGEITSNRYLKLEGVEYQIIKNLDTLRWEVRVMTWEHGNDFRYVRPY